MGLEKLIQTVAIIVVLAASTGQLPKMIREVRMAQAQLIQETKASGWGMPYLLKSK
jgi:hypothetical protein